MGKIVPIRFVDREGNSSSPDTGDPREAIPVMDVIARFDRDRTMRPPQPHEMTIPALVDTGAAMNVCSPELISAIGAPWVDSNILNGVNSTTSSPRHVCHLLFPSANLQLETDVNVLPLQDHGHCFNLIIGRLILQLGQLVMDYPANRFYWIIPWPQQIQQGK